MNIDRLLGLFLLGGFAAWLIYMAKEDETGQPIEPGQAPLAPTTTEPSKILGIMAEAIKRYEGWFQGSVSWRNNNPGNLKYAGQPGAIGKDQWGHAIFENYEQGWNALLRQIQRMLDGSSSLYPSEFTLRQAMNRYAETNGDQYAVYIASKLGISPDTRLKDIGTIAKV